MECRRRCRCLEAKRRGRAERCEWGIGRRRVSVMIVARGQIETLSEIQRDWLARPGRFDGNRQSERRRVVARGGRPDSFPKGRPRRGRRR